MDRTRGAAVLVTDPVLVEVTRGDIVESTHRGAIAVVDATGSIRAAVGDVGRAVFPRSAVKALQALPLIESGAADRYGFGQGELALACASHSGEERHVETVRRILAAAGRDANDLECGVHPPIDRAAAEDLIRAGKAPSALHNNCSGKHAGFICVACAAGMPVAGYVEAVHPVQREVTAALETMTDTSLRPADAGIDGCSIPAYAVPLQNLALGMARLVTGERLAPVRAKAAARLVEACLAEPFMVGGTGRFDTVVMTQFEGRAFTKGGAEGVRCAGFPELGLGVALKCDDGAGRAAEVAMAAVIDAFLTPDTAERARFANLLAHPVLSRKGVKVGEVRPVGGLVEALRAGRRLS
jgi:L-asparaginase II